MRIREDDFSGPETSALLRTHLEHCRATSPPESVHALDLDRLRAPDITFWTAWDEAELLACGALKELDPAHGEIKSMHTLAKRRRQGVGKAIVRHIVAEARIRNYRRLSLETGSMDAFAPARALYSGFGFVACEPFADYRPDPNSVFMTLDLTNRLVPDAASG